MTLPSSQIFFFEFNWDSHKEISFSHFSKNDTVNFLLFFILECILGKIGIFFPIYAIFFLKIKL